MLVTLFPEYPNSDVLLWVVSETVEFLLVAAPVLVNLDEGFEEDVLVEELFESLACFGVHLLDGDTLMTDDDALLRVTLNIDCCHDVYALLRLLEGSAAHLYGVRYLLVVVEEYLLADYLRDEESRRLVRQLLLIKEGR